MKKLKKLFPFIRERSIVFSAGLVLVFVLTNTGFLVYNNRVQVKAMAVQAEAQEIQMLFGQVWDDVVRNLDLGLRGYALIKDEGMLTPYTNGKNLYEEYQKKIHEMLVAQGYPDIEGFEKVSGSINAYIRTVDNMLQMINANNMDLFYNELKLDHGLALWKVFEKYSKEVNAYQDAQTAAAAFAYKKANKRMTIIQFLLGIIGAPTLLFMIIRFVKDERMRRRWFNELDKSNRAYLFNPGEIVSGENEQDLINQSIENLKRAATFINEISSGNLDATWDNLNEENRKYNEKNLAGELIHMRERMKALKVEDARRMWTTEGEARFSEIIRTHQHDMQELCDNSIAFITKYLSAQQGALFLLREEVAESYLELKACYAFDRKKYVERRIEIGQGLVGQTFLENDTAMLTDVPQQYTYITSGLGESTPTCLMVSPMKYNEKTQAVVEIASFNKFEPHQLEWVKKIGEIMASTLISINTAEKTQALLKQFQEQTERLRSQEEELRQNLEEMEATQEEMRRQEEELKKRR